MQSTRTTRGADQQETSQASRFPQNSSTGPNGGPRGSTPPGTSPNGRSSWLRWLIFIIVINLLFYAPLLFGSSSGGPAINLPVTIDLPERRGREAILKIHTRTVPLAPDVNLEDLARVTRGFSGADLENLVNEAALAAARRGSAQVSRQDFENALDKLLLGGKREALMDERERRTVAYHEGGHALVAAVLPDVDPLYKVTIVPRGRSLGVTQFRPEEDRRNIPRAYLIERLAVALGGRTAEELALGDITTGAENDLKEATQMARRMVSEWGMGEQTGPVVYDLSDGTPYLSQQQPEDHPRLYSEATAQRLDAEVERLITQAHQQARSVLTEHREALEHLAQALLQEEVLEREQVLTIVNGIQNSQGDAGSEQASQQTLIAGS